MFGKKDSIDNTRGIEDIKKENITTRVDIENKEIIFELNGIKVGTFEGKKTIADETILNNTMKKIAKTLILGETNYIDVPKKITIDFKEKNIKKDNNINKENTQENMKVIDIREPRYTLESVYLKEESKKQIIDTILMKKYKEKIFKEWGLEETIKSDRALILNFYGPAGTGKSLAAEAIAGSLGKKLYAVNYSELESKYVGETPKNIKNVFRRASEEDAVLVFDEADSFLGKRLSNITQSSDYGVNITRSVMLLELEKFNGIVIFTTNLLENYDEAFKRRILSNVKFDLPDEEGRNKIWEIHIPEKLPLEDNVNSKILAKKYTEISGADIKDIILFAAINTVSNKKESIGLEEFDLAYKYIKARYDKEKSDIKFDVVSEKTEKITDKEYNEIFDKEA